MIPYGEVFSPRAHLARRRIRLSLRPLSKMTALSLLLTLVPLAPFAVGQISPTNPFGLSGPGWVPNATLGPPLELWHEFYDHWPTGIAVSKTGRLFANFPVANSINFT